MDNSWRRISEELNTRVIDDPVTRCKDILELSYNHLPAHLKACFLYFGAFQEDRDVPARKLIQLWMAEGFIPKIEERTMEEIGEVCLRDLIDRSLILISQMKSTGGVKACRIHDLLLELCRSTSEGDRFLQIKTSKDTPYDSFHYLDDDEDFDPDDPPHSAKYERHRVCVHLKRKHFVYSRPSAPCTRSLLFFASGDTYPRHPYDISFIFKNFELLRVLDLESINLGSSISAAIEVLVLLRYLALSGDLVSIPQSISNLWKLQTFIVKGLSGRVLLPDTFWCMTSLRHVHVKNRAAFKKAVNFENSKRLENLVTFSLPTLSHGQETEKMLKKLPNLRKFRCIFHEAWDSSGQCNPFPRLDFLDKLESLNIKYSGRGDCNPHQFHLSPNLRKLTLSKFHLSKNHLSTIGKLPKLEVLKLLSGSLEEQIWNMNEDEFKELKYLKLESLEIVEWNASSNNLPQLQQLVIWNCKDLEEISPDLFEVCTLEIVEVRRCSPSLEKYIRDNGEQIEGIKILISK